VKLPPPLRRKALDMQEKVLTRVKPDLEKVRKRALRGDVPLMSPLAIWPPPPIAFGLPIPSEAFGSS
jgi:hypothetical protein